MHESTEVYRALKISEVGDPFLVWALCFEFTFKHVWRNTRSLTHILWELTAVPTRPEGVHLHQPFNAMQTTLKALGKDVIGVVRSRHDLFKTFTVADLSATH